MWLVSHDDEFRTKRDDVLHVYYDTPADEHVICLDEKTGMQALERRYPDIAMKPGQPTRREFEYIRHGSLCLMGAYNVRARKLFGFISEDHDSSTFIDLLELADVCHPTGRGHFVCDNLSAHNTDDVIDWLEDHPRWTMHFTPKHASWLNQIECAFSIIGRHVLTRGTFASLEELRQRVYEYLIWFNQQSAAPLRFRHRHTRSLGSSSVITVERASTRRSLRALRAQSGGTRFSSSSHQTEEGATTGGTFFSFQSVLALGE